MVNLPSPGDTSWYGWATEIHDLSHNAYYTKAEVETMIAEATGTQPKPPDPPPVGDEPTAVDATGNNANMTITMVWEPPAATGGKTIAGYTAFRNNPNWETSTPLATTARSFVFTNFIADVSYTVGVKAVFTDGTASNYAYAPVVKFASTSGPVVPGTAKIMPTGDSLTAVDATALGYKGILLDSLVADGNTINYVGPYTSTGPAGLKDPHHYGLSGAQTSTLLGQYLATTTIGGMVTTHTPDIALLLIGTNDLWSNVAVATALTRYRTALDQAYASKANLKIVACTIPLMGVTQESQRAAFNSGIRQIVLDYKAAGKAIWLVELENTLVSADLQSDGIHWTANGHSKVAVAMESVVQTAISAPTDGGDGGGDGGGTTGTAPMPYPVHPVTTYHMCWSNSGSPPVLDTPANCNELRLAFFQNNQITGPASEGSIATLGARLKQLRARGVRIVASVGGEAGSVNTSNRPAFVAGIMNFSNTYCPLDGLDWDIEASGLIQADVLDICAQLKQQRGPNFAITMAPNGNNISTYLTVGKALHDRGMLSNFGQQFYDTEVSQSAMMGRLNEFVGRGMPISKYSIGMMTPPGRLSANNYWDVATSVSRLNAAKAAYPTLGGAYHWEAGQPLAPSWFTSVGNIIKTW